MSDTIHFSCVQCGKCCHDLRLPLSVDEAIGWLSDGGDIQIYAEAIPWPEEPPSDDLQAQHKMRQSFVGRSGTLPVRIAITLVGSFDGPCPHLQTDMRCGAYSKRPRVCRIYPAEVNPFIRLDPASKLCPPEAWSKDKPLILNDKIIADLEVDRHIAQSRDAIFRDCRAKEQLSIGLSISTAALANEGLAVYSPPRKMALDALKAARQSDPALLAGHPIQWAITTNRASTLAILEEIGAQAIPSDCATIDTMTFLPFQAS